METSVRDPEVPGGGGRELGKVKSRVIHNRIINLFLGNNKYKPITRNKCETLAWNRIAPKNSNKKENAKQDCEIKLWTSKSKVQSKT